MPFWKVKVTDHDSQGRQSESVYFVAEPDNTEAILTTYDLHTLSKHLHEGIDEVPNVDLEEIDEDTANKSRGWISNFFGR